MLLSTHRHASTPSCSSGAHRIAGASCASMWVTSLYLPLDGLLLWAFALGHEQRTGFLKLVAAGVSMPAPALTGPDPAC